MKLTEKCCGRGFDSRPLQNQGGGIGFDVVTSTNMDDTKCQERYSDKLNNRKR